MPKALEDVAKDALDLPSRQRMLLAGLLLETADSSGENEVDAAWEAEIHDRALAVNEGRVAGVPIEEVMRAAEARLAP